MKKQVRQQKENRFVELVETAYNKNKGNRIRHLVRILADSYQENPERLKSYFNNKNFLITGIATSAYHFLTGDIKPIQSRKFGGLGAIINDSEKGLTFNRNQLYFSKNSGDALWDSENSGDALKYSKNSGDALKYSKNSDSALRDSKNSGDALKYSENSDSALKDSENSDYALWGSKNSVDALWGSKNSGDALKYSKNSDSALRDSKNSGDALKHSQ